MIIFVENVTRIVLQVNALREVMNLITMINALNANKIQHLQNFCKAILILVGYVFMQLFVGLINV